MVGSWMVTVLSWRLLDGCCEFLEASECFRMVAVDLCRPLDGDCLFLEASGWLLVIPEGFCYWQSWWLLDTCCYFLLLHYCTIMSHFLPIHIAVEG